MIFPLGHEYGCDTRYRNILSFIGTYMLGTYITGNVRCNVHYFFIHIFILERMLNWPVNTSHTNILSDVHCLITMRNSHRFSLLLETTEISNNTDTESLISEVEKKRCNVDLHAVVCKAWGSVHIDIVAYLWDAFAICSFSSFVCLSNINMYVRGVWKRYNLTILHISCTSFANWGKKKGKKQKRVCTVYKYMK